MELVRQRYDWKRVKADAMLPYFNHTADAFLHENPTVAEVGPATDVFSNKISGLLFYGRRSSN